MSAVEKTICGMIFRVPRNLETALGLGITVNMFTNPLCAKIFSKYIEAKLQNVVIDLQSFCVLFDEHAVQIISMVEDAPISQNFEYFCKLMLDIEWRKSCAVELSALTQQMIKADFSQNSSKFRLLLSQTAQKYSKDVAPSFKGISFNEVASRYVDDFEDRVVRYAQGEKRGIATGFSILNDCFGGWIGGRLYIVAARTSLGKTTLAVNFMWEAAKQNKHASFFTNEMSDSDILEKIISYVGGINIAKMSAGAVSEDELNRIHFALQQIVLKPGSINKKAGRLLETFEMECRRLKDLGELDIVFLDYIQQMHSHSRQFSSRHSELSYISDRIKSLALELNIPMIALAQINREAEKGSAANEPPSLAHIKDSGSIEQDADAVVILHRDRDAIDGKAVLRIAKNRFGKTGIWEIQSNLAFNKFMEWRIDVD